MPLSNDTPQRQRAEGSGREKWNKTTQPQRFYLSSIYCMMQTEHQQPLNIFIHKIVFSLALSVKSGFLFAYMTSCVYMGCCMCGVDACNIHFVSISLETVQFFISFFRFISLISLGDFAYCGLGSTTGLIVSPRYRCVLEQLIMMRVCVCVRGCIITSSFCLTLFNRIKTVYFQCLRHFKHQI